MESEIQLKMAAVVSSWLVDILQRNAAGDSVSEFVGLIRKAVCCMRQVTRDLRKVLASRNMDLGFPL